MKYVLTASFAQSERSSIIIADISDEILNIASVRPTFVQYSDLNSRHFEHAKFPVVFSASQRSLF